MDAMRDDDTTRPGVPVSDESAAITVDRLLEGGLRVMLQPIIDLRSTMPLGFEALVRPADDLPLRGAGEVIERFEAEGRATELDVAVRRLALPLLAATDDGNRLFLNTISGSFANAGFAAALAADAAAAGVDPSRVVIELTEHVGEVDWEQVQTTADELRSAGFEVALDDVGAGLSGLNRMMSIRPDWIKLDLELVRDVDFDPLRQNLLRFLVEFARLSGIRVVAEGIEREGELLTLLSLGVPAGQGYHLGRPLAPEAWLTDPDAEADAGRGAAAARDTAGARFGDVPLLSISAPPLTAGPGTPAAILLTRMRDTLGGHFAVIVRDGRPAGWISDRTIRRAVEHDPSAMVADLPLHGLACIRRDASVAEGLLLIAEGRDDDELPLLVITGEDGTLVGAVTPRQMLVAAAEPRLRPTAHVAPVTGLPDRVQADQWLAVRRELEDAGDLAFIDVRHFAGYNAAYGFEKGDELLLRLGGLLRTAVRRRPDAFTFVAHLGEDRFMVALRADRQAALEELLEEFEALRGELFPPGDLAHGGVVLSSGETSPLASLRTIVFEGAFRGTSTVSDLHRRALALRPDADRLAPTGPGGFVLRRCPANDPVRRIA